MHCIAVERPRQPPGAADLEREIGPTIGNSIAIVSTNSRETRFECFRHDLSRDNADRMRPQMSVEPVAKPPRHEVLADVTMRYLGERVHAGVGAARAVDADLLAANRLDRIFHCALDRGAVFLDLPAAKRRAVVFDDQFVTGHQLRRAGGLSGVPRRNSSAFIGALPARCNSRIRTAPSPQATLRRSSSNSPGAPEPCATAQRRSFTRAGSPSSGISHHAPGNGERPWMWRSTARAGLFQPVRDSALSILAA